MRWSAKTPVSHPCLDVGVFTVQGTLVGLVGVAHVGQGREQDGARLAEAGVREFVGERRNSVFPVPPRSVLKLDDYPEANALAREAALAVATQRHASIRALYLYSKPGMGRTRYSEWMWPDSSSWA